MQLNRIDVGEGVADMQLLHRMDVDACLTTQNAGVARSKLIGWRVVDEDWLIILICQLLAIDEWLMRLANSESSAEMIDEE